MRLLVDENLDWSVVERLRESGHEVTSVAEMEPGIPDEIVLRKANELAAMLVTEDKDSGELAFRQLLVNHGVILLRLAGLPVSAKAEVLITVPAAHAPELTGAFAIVSPGMVRIRRREEIPESD